MEGKKKFEKPELKVVEMKLAGVTCGSCGLHYCGTECGADGGCKMVL